MSGREFPSPFTAPELSAKETSRLFVHGVLATALCFVILGPLRYSQGDAVNSRLATVYSLSKYSTWAIDTPLDQPPNPYEQGTIDKVMVNGRILSSKPGILPLLMAGEYYLMHRFFGWTLDGGKDTDKIVRVMTITLVGASYLLAAIFFVRTLKLFRAPSHLHAILALSLCFGTQLWGYSICINNHVPAVGMLMPALYLALGLGTGRLAPSPWRFFLFGLTGAMVFTLDMPATVFVAFAGLWLLRKYPAMTLTWTVVGALGPLTTYAWIQYENTGSILPVQTRKDLYLYEGAYWRNPQGIDALNEAKLPYLFHMTFGRCGLFVLFPILLAGLAAAVKALWMRRMPLRGPVLGGAVAFLVLTAYYVKSTNNYGGEAYGFRWYIVAMPVLMLMSVPLLASLRKRWHWLLIAVMVGISFYSAFECATSPWGNNRQWTTRLFLGPTYGPINPE